MKWSTKDGAPRRAHRWLIAVAGLAGVIVVAIVCGVNPAHSLWGSDERGQGALTLLSYLVVGTVVATHLQSPTQARRLLIALALTGVPLTVIGGLQV